MTAEEMKSAAESILSYFGSYTVNEAEISYSLTIESSSFANQIGNPTKRMIEINGDEMKVTNPTRLARQYANPFPRALASSRLPIDHWGSVA